jgi:SAM-dependent methyltransferase
VAIIACFRAIRHELSKSKHDKMAKHSMISNKQLLLMSPEPWLEPILRHLRLHRILRCIPKNAILLDIGCGPEFVLLKALSPQLKQGFGLDFKVDPQHWHNLTIQQLVLDTQLPFADNSLDCVTMLAVLEHIEQEQAIAQEIHRVLKPGGELILTVPSIWAKPVLEFLAFQLKWVNPLEILDHKRYYTRPHLQQLLVEKVGFTTFTHRYFQLFMNNFCRVQKGHNSL